MTYDFCMARGTDVRRMIRLLSECSRTAIHLKGATVRMTLRSSPYSSSPVDVLDSSAQDGRCELDEEQGLIKLFWPNQITRSLPLGRLFYALDIENFSGEVSRVLEGRITVSE